MAIGAAIAESGCANHVDPLEWHPSGLPYASAELWERLGPVIEKIAREAVLG